MESDISRENLKRVAQDAGIDYSYLWYILSQKRRPGRKVAEKLEEATGIPAPAWIWPEKYRNHYIEQYGKRSRKKRKE